VAGKILPGAAALTAALVPEEIATHQPYLPLNTHSPMTFTESRIARVRASHRYLLSDVRMSIKSNRCTAIYA
jgi:hypothetical protein